MAAPGWDSFHEALAGPCLRRGSLQPFITGLFVCQPAKSIWELRIIRCVRGEERLVLQTSIFFPCSSASSLTRGLGGSFVPSSAVAVSR